MNNALVYLGGLVVMVLTALFAIPSFIDWNGYRGIFEEQASRVLGRDVRVAGTVNVRFLPSPYVKFERIRIADSDESSQDPLFRAESFKLWLAVPPLLRGVFEANEIELKRPVLRLAADAKGGGNWSNLTFAAGALPFVPAEVMLEQVRIVNGVVSLINAKGSELARIEKVNGDVTADSLAGPFKFKGVLNWEGSDRQVKIATARPAADGSFRFKTTVTVPATGNSYVVDGSMTDFKQRPQLTGDLTAKVLVDDTDAEDANARKPAASGAERIKGDNVQSVDLRSKVFADTAGLKLEDLALSLERTGPPQIITGDAKIAWAEKVNVDASLSSRWLDLDLDSGQQGAQTTRPTDVARRLFETLTALMPVEAETNVRLKFDQVNLGGDSVSGVRLAVVREGGPLELKEFRANIPGGGRLALDGVLDVAAVPATFNGNMTLDGQSVLRFLSWATKDSSVAKGRTDSSFLVAGQLQLTGRSVHLRNAAAELGELPLSGELKLDGDARRRLELTLEADKIDAGQLFPGSVGLRALKSFAAPPSASAAPDDAAPAPAAGRTALFDPTGSDMVLKVRAGEVVDGDRVLKDVAAILLLEDDRLTVEQLRFTTDEGLEADITGACDEVRTHPQGSLRGTIATSSSAAVNKLFTLLDLEGADAARVRLATLAPFRLAGNVNFGQRAPDAVDIVADGVADGGRFTATVNLDGARRDWQAAPVDIVASIDGSRAAHTLSSLLQQDKPSGRVSGQTGRKLLVKSAGVPEKGLASIISLHGEGLSVDYSGRITVPGEGQPTAAGLVTADATDTRELLNIAGLSFGAGIGKVPLQSEADLTLAGSELTLVPRRLQIAGSNITGTVSLTTAENKPLNIAANLEVDAAELPHLLNPLLSAPIVRQEAETEPPPPPPPVPANRRQPEITPSTQLADAALTPGIWPEQGFDLSVLDRVGGTISVHFNALRLDEGLTVSDANLTVVLAPQSVRVEKLQGGALGGRMTAELALERASAGVGLTGKIRVGTAETGEGASAPQNTKTASSLDLEFDGRALSPAALMTALKGKGEINLGDVTLSGMGPGPVAKAAEAGLLGTGPSSGEELSQALKAGLKQGQIRLGALKIPVAIADGAMRLERVSLETEEGRSTFETALELATMKIDSEWKIEAKVASKASDPASEKVLLPAVNVVYSGKLKDFARIEPTVETAALERELVVRKMEQDVAELERLRELDQKKAKDEQERQKALELEDTAGDPKPESAPAPEGAANGSPTTAIDEAAQSSSPPPAPPRKPRSSTVFKKPASPAWKPFEISPY